MHTHRHARMHIYLQVQPVTPQGPMPCSPGLTPHIAGQLGQAGQRRLNSQVGRRKSGKADMGRRALSTNEHRPPAVLLPKSQRNSLETVSRCSLHCDSPSVHTAPSAMQLPEAVTVLVRGYAHQPAARSPSALFSGSGALSPRCWPSCRASLWPRT